MSRVEETVACFGRGCSCAQAILLNYGPELGLSREMACQLGSGLAGGCRAGEICGAVAAACLLLGLRYGPKGPATGDQPEAEAARAVAYQRIADLTQRFLAKHDYLRCKDLLGCDISTPAGQQAAREWKLFETLCPPHIRSAAEILEELL